MAWMTMSPRSYTALDDGRPLQVRVNPLCVTVYDDAKTEAHVTDGLVGEEQVVCVYIPAMGTAVVCNGVNMITEMAPNDWHAPLDTVKAVVIGEAALHS